MLTSAANVTSGAGLTTTVVNGATTVGIDPTVFQKRVTGNCPSGAISQINQDGSVQCVNFSGPQFIAMYGDDGLDDPRYIGMVATRLVTDQPIAVTKVSYTVGLPGYGFTPAVARVTNGTIYEDIPITVSTAKYDTDDHILVFPAGSEIKLTLTQAAYCGTGYSYAYFLPCKWAVPCVIVWQAQQTLPPARRT